ncbi:MAG: M6 family metalloprotease domain-containing protein [Nitrososphaerota archaeon]
MEFKQVYLAALLIVVISSVIFISSTDASTSEVNVIVIPVDFPDQPGGGPPETYVSKINTSMGEYWREVSYGKISVKLYTVSKWLRLDRKYSFYGEDADGVDENPCRLVIDAVKVADALIDFKKYDYIMVMHSGRDQAYTHEEGDVYSLSAFCGRIPVDEGEIVEYVAIVSYLDPLGIWAHEFGHLLGLPDLYDTSSREEYDTFLGPWDLMAEGSWNGPLGSPGSVPATLTSWSRMKLGWINDTDVLVVEEGSKVKVILKPLHESEGLRVVKIPADIPRRYYLIEAREKTGYDQYLPSRGVLILYVDENKDSGQGIVKAIPPPDRSLYQATYNVGSIFQDNNLHLVVRVDGGSAEGYVLTIVYRLPKHILKISTFPFGKVWVNGTEYAGDENGLVMIALDEGTYTVNVQEEYTQDNVRYVFEGWSDGLNESTRIIILDRDVEYALNYSIFYRVEVSTDYGEIYGGGWYKDGEKATIELVTDTIIDFGNNTRLVFSGWSGDIESNQPKIYFTVGSPKIIKAVWTKQYKVTMSTTPNHIEDRWIKEGESITIEAPREIDLDNKTKLIFYRWSCTDSSDEKIVLRVSRPLFIEAVWRRSYLVEITYLKDLDERSYWIGEGEELRLDTELYRYLSENLRLKFNGWLGDIQSKERNFTIVVSSPISVSVNWIKEYRVQPRFTTIDGEPLTIRPSRLILYRDSEYIEWVGEQVWIKEGAWTIGEITWKGLDISIGEDIVIDDVTIVIPTTLKKIKVEAFDLLGRRLQDLDMSVVVDDLEVFRVCGGEQDVYVPLNVKSMLIVSYGLTSVRVAAPANDLEITMPVISFTPVFHIALGQIILIITAMILLASIVYYMKKPAKIRANTISVSMDTKMMSLTEL